jgi:small subunit ribosomal protein S1
MNSDSPIEEKEEKQGDNEDTNTGGAEELQPQPLSSQDDNVEHDDLEGVEEEDQGEAHGLKEEEEKPVEAPVASGDKKQGADPLLGDDDKPTVFMTSSGLKVRADLYDGGRYTPEEYEKMAKLYDETFTNIAEGEVVQGTVMKIQGHSVILDVGFKSEGSVSLDEFRDPESVSVGDKIDVYLENLEDQEGVIVFSKKKADFLKVWDNVKQCYDRDEPIEGTISRKIKGGMVVNILGIDAFLPGSQIGLRRVSDLDSLIGETYSFKIIKLNKRRRNIVVSRRILLEEERDNQRRKLLAEIEIGQERKGVVKNITDFGAFIDLGGVDGLLHITDMSWGRISHPSELVTIGDELTVKILDIDIDRGRISLGLKQMTPYPWENIEEKYPVGQKVRGKVVSLANYGAFVELEKGVEGLVHISEMSWTRHIRHPSKILAIGDIVEAVVLSIDPKAEKISLGIKQLESDPWLSLAEKYPPGTLIEGRVRNLTSFGAFVEIEEGIDGLVHVSDMSWTRRVMHPGEILKKGDHVKVVVLKIDTEERRISLGLKQVQENPWEELSLTYKEGEETTGKIVRILDKGLVVDLGNDVEGFVPISQVERKTPKPLAQEFNVGDSLSLHVLECDRDNHRIVLSASGLIVEDVPEVPEEAEAPGDDASAEEVKHAEQEETGVKTVEEPGADLAVEEEPPSIKTEEGNDTTEGEGEGGTPE